MTDDAKGSLAALLICVVIVGVFSAIGWGCNSIKCGARWGESGMRTSWGPLKGCTVEVKPGRWIPADRYRETP